MLLAGRTVSASLPLRQGIVRCSPSTTPRFEAPRAIPRSSDACTSATASSVAAAVDAQVPSAGTNRPREPPMPSQSLPSHVAIVMDGNRRWARVRGLPSFAGHQAGVNALREIVRCCGEFNIPALTVFAFSSENWKRSDTEVNFLLTLIEQVIGEEVASLQKAGVKLKFVGDLSQLSPALVARLNEAESQTANGSRLFLTVAISYSGRQDLTHAIQKACLDVAEGRLLASQVTAESLLERLSLSHLPPDLRDADLIIRTSGEKRISNFLMWEAAYSELWFTETLWPDFGHQEFEAALRDYAQRNRRYGFM